MGDTKMKFSEGDSVPEDWYETDSPLLLMFGTAVETWINEAGERVVSGVINRGSCLIHADAEDLSATVRFEPKLKLEWRASQDYIDEMIEQAIGLPTKH